MRTLKKQARKKKGRSKITIQQIVDGIKFLSEGIGNAITIHKLFSWLTWVITGPDDLNILFFKLVYSLSYLLEKYVNELIGGFR
ncbi:MAG: hypothetical protein IPP86_00200 [Bacteroidetes bacterium]|nr:hypothetical protein [Bacteroidota bacterium]